MEILLSLLPSFILVIAWIVAIVFAVRMIRNGGGRPERFLLIGVSLMLAGSVVGSVWTGISPLLGQRLAESGANYRTIGWTFSSINFVRAVISLAGIICLVYVECPPKRIPLIVLDFEKKEGGQNGKERVYTGADHQ